MPVQPINLLILDVNMPILNGFETLNLVKEMYNRLNAQMKDNDPLVRRSHSL